MFSLSSSDISAQLRSPFLLRKWKLTYMIIVTSVSTYTRQEILNMELDRLTGLQSKPDPLEAFHLNMFELILVLERLWLPGRSNL